MEGWKDMDVCTTPVTLNHISEEESKLSNESFFAYKGGI